MAKLFSKAFAPTPEEVRRDQQLHARIAALKTFVRPSQLDVPPALQDDASLLVRQGEVGVPWGEWGRGWQWKWRWK